MERKLARSALVLMTACAVLLAPAAVASPESDAANDAINQAWQAAGQPEVRELMRERQRELAALGDSVIEGRDIGRVVVPGAEVKVYLVADEAVRAGRRLAARPGSVAETLAAEMHRRDDADAPQMLPAPDAVHIDTTNLRVEEVVAKIETLVTEKLSSRR